MPQNIQINLIEPLLESMESGASIFWEKSDWITKMEVDLYHHILAKLLSSEN